MGEKRNLEEKEVFAPRQFQFGSQTPIASGSTRRRQLQTRFYYPVFRPSPTPFQIISHPACIDEDGGSSGQAIFDSISTWPVFYYDRYESCITIAGADYCVIAADFNPGQLKISKLSSKCVMASCGFQDDVKALQEALSAENLRYETEHNKPMSCPQMCRLFRDFQKCHPNYVFVVLGGLDSEGKGCFFHHYSLVPRVRHSDAAETMAPILKYKLPAKDVLAQLSETEAVKLAQEVFESAINTGDELEIAVISASGVRHIKVDLRASESSQLGEPPLKRHKWEDVSDILF